MRQEELYDSIKVCEHDSDYSVLYDFVGPTICYAFMQSECSTITS